MTLGARRRREVAPEPGVVVRGELLRFTRKTEDGWGVGLLRLADGGQVELTGKLLDAKPGDAVELTGRQVEHPTWGLQFKVESVVVERPQSPDGVVRWLVATLPDVGPARAAQMIEHFGGVDGLWHAIENDHARLAELKGVTLERAAAIHATYTAERSNRDLMVQLRTWGLTSNQIQKCLDEWETLDAVVDKIRANPYLLARYVDGFGFTRADVVAQLTGIKPNAPERIEAGIVFTLEQAMQSGSVFLYGGALQKIAADDLLHIDRSDVGRGILAAARTQLVVRRGARVYLARMEAAETSCAASVRRLLKGR